MKTNNTVGGVIMNKESVSKNSKYKDYLLEHGIKMKHEAAKINCTPSTFSHKLHGNNSSFSINEALVIARSHHTTIERLFGDEL